MSKEKGREQIFQLGARFINDAIEKELMPRISKMIWDDTLKRLIEDYFVDKFQEMKNKMAFLDKREYPRVSLYMDGDRLKVNVQGWMHILENTIFLGSYQYNRDTYFDYYLEGDVLPDEEKRFCEFEGDNNNILIRYGDNPKEIYRRSISDAEGYGAKWKVGLDFYKKLGEMLLINPISLLSVEEVVEERKDELEGEVIENV